MQRFQLISAFAVCLFVMTTVGCGGSPSNEVVQPADTGMSAADQQTYQEAMKKQMQEARR